MRKKCLLAVYEITHGFETLLFEKVSFELCEGETMAVVGRSGTGKSTLLHICAGFIVPQEGEVELLGDTISGRSTHEIEMLRRYDLGIVFQFHYLFKGMSALENIEVATLLANETLDKELLEKLEIADVIDHKIGDLSGGQQQRVSIARVLSKKPRIIFADEPTGNLDDETAHLVMDVLEGYVKEENAAMFLVTHDTSLARRCDKRYRIDNKKLTQE